ncbi:MAG: futalosine hydrolase [Planctomycetota bacterium]
MGQAETSTILLVPTRLEAHLLFGREPKDGEALKELPGAPIFALTGFGLAAAGVKTANALHRHPGITRAFLLGIAGSYELGRANIGELVAAESVVVDGIGTGEGASFESADALGFRQLEDLAPGPLALARPKTVKTQGRLLSVAAAAGSCDEAAQRQLRYPSALFEDMEGWAVALGCREGKVPLAIVRAISNAVGDRNAGAWKIEEALATLRRHLPILLSP